MLTLYDDDGQQLKLQINFSDNGEEKTSYINIDSDKYIEIWNGNIGNGDILFIPGISQSSYKFRNYILVLRNDTINLTSLFTIPSFMVNGTPTNIGHVIKSSILGEIIVSIIPQYIQGGNPIQIVPNSVQLVKVYAELN